MTRRAEPPSAPGPRPVLRSSGRRHHLPVRHHEAHVGRRASWLRASVLGANDGLLSTASLLVGVAAADAGRSVLLATGVASLVAGAGSMAIGEYSSVSSQRDAERADLAAEAEELATMPGAELAELAAIYRGRGLPPELADEVARSLTEQDALTAHARDELGLDPTELARPLEAAVTSALSFAAGALVPLLVILAAGPATRVPAVVVATVIGLGALGAFGARLGHAPWRRAAVRVVVGGALALVVSGLVGQLFDVAVS